MPDTYAGSGWCCVDCLFLLANGDMPTEMSAPERVAWLAEIDRRNTGYDITLGMPRERHDCTEDYGGLTAGEAGGECECERLTFTWSACDVCGSPLGGEREAVSWFKMPERGMS